jgi:hypothetical protein
MDGPALRTVRQLAYLVEFPEWLNFRAAAEM